LVEREQRIHRQLARFLLVGGLSFVIDLSAMALLIHTFDVAGNEAGLIVCRVLAWSVAIVFAFFMNAAVTFGASIKHSSFVSYLLIQGVGALINLGSYSALILGPIPQRPLLALMIGSALATIGNFVLVRKYVYRFNQVQDESEN